MATQDFPAYNRPTTLKCFSSINPRPLRALGQTSRPKKLPLLSQRSSPFAGYSLKTHIVPSACPRHACKLAQSVPHGGSSDERKARTMRLSQELLQAATWKDTSEHYDRPDASQLDTPLFNVINRYTLRKLSDMTRPRVTLLVLHANGFGKEIWEPCLRSLIAHADGDDETPFIEEIWSMDAVNHGDSAVINEGALGDTFDWADNARDILSFILRYMPLSSADSQDVQVLPAIPHDIGHSRESVSLEGRVIVGLGHSMGGCSATRAAIHAPWLFSSLILVDPVIAPAYSDRSSHVARNVTLALSRRAQWNSREEALSLFKNSPFFGAWDPSVLDAYIKYGLRDSGDFVTLKTSGYQEAVNFAESYVPIETWELLDQLPTDTELFFIMAGTGATVSGGEDAAPHVVWRRPVNSSNIRIPGAGHLIVQEKPEELGIIISQFLKRKYGKVTHARL